MAKQPAASPCKKAIKLLTQYERLAEKYGIHISAARLADLNRLRDDGRITSAELPAKLRSEFPGELAGKTLAAIRAECGM